MVPKEHVTGFDGAEVTLNLTVNELAKSALVVDPNLFSKFLCMLLFQLT
jgi:hypothetical protein